MLLPTSLDHRDADARLVQRLRAGDEIAFEAIVVRHRARLLAFARSILRNRSDAAEDVVQEALMRAHRALLRDDREIALGPWLGKLTRNCALDEISRIRADTVPLDAPIALPALVDPDGPAEQHERRVTMRTMLDGIATLPEDQRHALVRREVDGASHADIAAELGISGAASRSLVFRARENLVKRDEALGARCSEVQDDLARAYRTGRRASAHVYRHLAGCKHCRAYRGQLRAMRDALHALHPGALLLVGVAAAKVGLTAKGALAGIVAKSPVAIGAAAAVTAAAAVGGTLVITGGQPSPATIHSAVLPNGVVVRGAPLPLGTDVEIRPVTLSAKPTTMTITCHTGHRVADLLRTDVAGVNVAYVGSTQPGLSRAATIGLSGPAGARINVAILCTVPGPAGALTPAFNPGPRTSSAVFKPRLAVVCVRRDSLRGSPGGGAVGSVMTREPLRVVGHRGGWSQVQTQYRAVGWLPTSDLCG